MARVIRGPQSPQPITHKIGLGAYFFEAADHHAEKMFQIDADFDVKETYKSAKIRAIRLAIALKKKGVKSDDIVMICSANNLNNAIPCLAALYLGAKVASLDPSLSLSDCQHCIKIVPPKCIFVQDSCLSLIEESVESIKSSAEIIVIGESLKYNTFKSLLQVSDEEKTFTPFVVDSTDTAFIFFSSGTTGLPKGICCSHEGFLNGLLKVQPIDLWKLDVIFHFTSLYWISAVMCLILSHVNGGCRVISSNVSPKRALEIFHTYKVTYSFMAPIFTYKLLLVPNADKYDLSSLYSITLGGTPMTGEQLVKTRNFFKHTKIQLCYGMTEACGFITIFDFAKDKDFYQSKPESSGKPAPDMSIKVVDIETRNLLPPNTKGEICLKSPYMTKGYYNMDTSDLFDEDGFIKTGDVGYYDEDDCIYIVDRIKEMFKYQSWHIVPTSIEQILMEHPDVQEAVVFGIPDEVDGDLPAAGVVLKSGSKTTIEDLHKYVNGIVADRQRLRGGIKIVEHIPKTPSSKVQRRKMKDIFLRLP